MTGVILAGGKSSRMGYDKKLIEIRGRHLIDLQVEVLSQIFDEVLVISNNPIDLEKSVPVYPDLIQDCGPLGGILTGLHYAGSGQVYFIGCDMPHINTDYIRYMMGLLDEDSYGMITRYGDWIEPLNAFYSKKNIPFIEAYIKTGRRHIHTYVKSRNFAYINEETAREYDRNWNMFLNLNTVKDVNKLLRGAGD